MRFRRFTLLLAETKESFLMAMGGLAAHKLRAALTLLGIVVGVFSIIVSMTAMRVLQKNIESELSELGAHTFTVDKWPAISFEGPEGWEKYRRRKPLTLGHQQTLSERATLAVAVGADMYFWRGEASSPYAKTDPDVLLEGITPEVLTCKGWSIADGRNLLASDIDSARFVCLLGNSLAKKLFPHSSAAGQTIKFDGLRYTVAGVLEPTTSMGEGRDNFLSVPITLGFNRYGGYNRRSISLLVQAPSQALYD
ncbi:MAG: hypothetical protein EPO07_13070, partial [Verrucomicrobia bacterium]